MGSEYYRGSYASSSRGDGGDRRKPSKTERALRTSDVIRQRDAELNRLIIKNPGDGLGDELVQARVQLSIDDLRSVHRRDNEALQARQNTEGFKAYETMLEEMYGAKKGKGRDFRWFINNKEDAIQTIRDWGDTGMMDKHTFETNSLSSIHMDELRWRGF
jgi:hypothetical protein